MIFDITYIFYFVSILTISLSVYKEEIFCYNEFEDPDKYIA